MLFSFCNDSLLVSTLLHQVIGLLCIMRVALRCTFSNFSKSDIEQDPHIPIPYVTLGSIPRK